MGILPGLYWINLNGIKVSLSDLDSTMLIFKIRTNIDTQRHLFSTTRKS